jgi:type I restriction enzyme S subunit
MKTKAYPKYKPSGVEWLGDVPEHWEVKALKYIFVNLDSNRIPISGEDRAGIENIYPYYGASGIIDYVDDYIYDETLILVAEDGANLLSRSTPLAFRAEGKYWVNNHAHILRPKYDAITYWECVLQIFEYAPYVSGSAQPKLTSDNLGSFILPVPPLPEQQAIAAFLDHETGRIDALIAKKKSLLSLLAEQRTAIISRAVTKGLNPSVKLKPSGVEWLGDVPEHWEVWKIAHSFELIGSGTTPPSDELEWYDGSIPWITTSELRESVICSTEKTVTKEATLKFSALKIFPKGSLAIAMYGATIGRLGIFGIDASTNQACCVMNGGQVFSIPFVYFWMQAFKESIILLASGGGQPNISQDKIKSIKIPCPSIPEQQAIAAFLDRETAKIDTLSAKVQTAIERLREYRTALISAAVTGKIDVREVVDELS